MTLDFLATMLSEINGCPRVGAPAVAIATVVERLASQPYRSPIGRVVLEKLAYFLTQAGVPTELAYEPRSFGPLSPEFPDARRKLVNHGILEERRLGQLIGVEPGPTLAKAQQVYADELASWDNEVERVVDLFMRVRTARQAELAATVHYAAT